MTHTRAYYEHSQNTKIILFPYCQLLVCCFQFRQEPTNLLYDNGLSFSPKVFVSNSLRHELIKLVSVKHSSLF
jgi:hypothetical protein